MKKFYILISLSMAFLLPKAVICQTMTVSDTFYYWKDTIKISYEDPNFSSTDWIGIYHAEDIPGEVNSIAWDYVPKDTGVISFTGLSTGEYIAYLFCCDGYDIMATSDTFRVLSPELESASDFYYQGDIMSFTYLSPIYSDKDWVGIYSADSFPSDTTSPLIKEYLPDSSGVININSAPLDSGDYVAYLFCCDGYEVLASDNFSLYPNRAILIPESFKLTPGQDIVFTYNSPNYSSTDWIGIFYEGDDPQSATPVAWKDLPSKSGIITFSGSLDAGKYVAYLLDISNNIIVQTDVITITSDYILVSSEKFLRGSPILINYKISSHQDNDWIGIYKEGTSPGNGSSVTWMYAPADSGSVSFTDTLDTGNYTVYTLCCDGYDVISKTTFSVVDASEAALMVTSISYVLDSTITFIYNSPDYSSTDWIGIYHPEDTPGEVNSITWSYLPSSNDSLDFSYSLTPGYYKAYLFCCDGYDILAGVHFWVVEETGTGVRQYRDVSKLNVYPNPASDQVTIETKDNTAILDIKIYNLTGQLLYRTQTTGGVSRKTISTASLSEGVYLLQIRTQNGNLTRKIVIR